MKLLQELSTLSEGRVKEEIMRLVDEALLQFNFHNKTHEEAVKGLIKRIKERDRKGLVAGMSDKEIEEYIDALEPEGWRDDNEIVEAEDPEDTNFPKLIAHADEFRVELDEDEQVNLLDGEGTVRVTMPLVIWKQLTR